MQRSRGNDIGPSPWQAAVALVCLLAAGGGVLGAQGIERVALAFADASPLERSRIALAAWQEQGVGPLASHGGGASIGRADLRSGALHFAGAEWTARGTLVSAVPGTGGAAVSAGELGLWAGASAGRAAISASAGWRGETGSPGTMRSALDVIVPVRGMTLTMGITNFSAFMHTSTDTLGGLIPYTYYARFLDSARGIWDSTARQGWRPGVNRKTAPQSEAVAHLGVGWKMFGALWYAHGERMMAAATGPSDSGAGRARRFAIAIDAQRSLLPGVALAVSLASRRYLDSLGSATIRVGFRWSPRPNRPTPSMEADRSVRFTWTGDGATRRAELRVSAPDAKRVEIESDLTGWLPVDLAPANEAGWWSVALPLPAGLHRLRLRLDGGAWGVPPGLPVESGDFGGLAGVIVLPPR